MRVPRLQYWQLLKISLRRINMDRYFCVMEDDKICDRCGECEMCDLNPEKVCDNCGKCIESDKEFEVIEIDEIIE